MGVFCQQIGEFIQNTDTVPDMENQGWKDFQEAMRLARGPVVPESEAPCPYDHDCPEPCDIEENNEENIDGGDRPQSDESDGSQI